MEADHYIREDQPSLVSSDLTSAAPWALDAGIFQSRHLSRRSFLAQISALSASVLIGCTPLRILFKSYPNKYDTDRQLEDGFLRALVITIIPGASQEEPNLTRMFRDSYYPFHTFCGFFVSDLARRSQRRFAQERFDLLSPDQRTRVIQDGLEADAVTARLYRGAILMAQVSYFAGIYDDQRGCPLIEYYGAGSGYSESRMYYQNTELDLARELTQDGNYS